MEFTGERMIPELISERDAVAQALFRQHIERYELARRFVADSDALDIACGVGYGASLLARSAASVVGVDVDAEAVAAATAKYGGKNLRFLVADGHDFRHEPFDVVVSFDTLEHLQQPERFLRTVASLVRPGGYLLISATTVETSDIYQYHLHDYEPDELRALVTGHGFEIRDELAQVDHFSPATLRSSWGLHSASLPLSRLAARPGHYLRRFWRMAVDGLEYRSLTLVCAPK